MTTVPATSAIDELLQRRASDRAWSVWRRAATIANVTAIFAVAITLRVWQLDHLPGVNGDEAWSGVQALRWLQGEQIAWRTPTGNPVNLFFLGPLVLLHAVFPPSFALLRSVAVASGILALGLNFALCRRVFGQSTAVVSTVLLAVLPINVAYSRFAWDASQSLLATVLVVYLPLLCLARPKAKTRDLIWTFVAFAAAIWVHPTNILAAPMALVPFVYQCWPAVSRRLHHPIRMRHAKSASVGIFSLSCLAGCLLSPWIDRAIARLISPGEVAAFAQNYVRLLSGTTVYRFISGSLADDGGMLSPWQRFDMFDVAGAVIIGIGLYGFCRLVRRRRESADVCLAIGAALTVFLFFLIAGPAAIAPHFERYGICLVAPAAIVLARGIVWWLLPRGWRWWGAMASWSAVAWLLLAGFHAHYFRFFEQTGGESHDTFRTAEMEPKLQAFRIATAGREIDEPLWIVTDEWWNYWPLEYLARGGKNVRVAHWDELPIELKNRQSCPSIWFIEFTGSRAERIALERLTRGGAAEKTILSDYAGRPLLSILHSAEKAVQNN